MGLNTVIVSTSKVLFPSMEELVCKTMVEFEGKRVDSDLRNKLRDMSKQYSNGKIAIQHLEDRILSYLNIDVQAEELTNTLQERMDFNRDVLEILSELHPSFEVKLFCELPRDWVIDQIQSFGQHYRISSHQFIFCEDFLQIDVENIWPFHVLEAYGLLKAESIIVDAHNWVTTRAVRNGLNAILYVNPFRLRQELTLRKLLPPS